MRGARFAGAWPVAFAAGLLVLFGARAVTGWIGGAAYAGGRRMADADRYEQALPLLARGALGPDRAASLWLAGNLHLNLFQARQVQGAEDPDLAPLLEAAYREETEAISLSPASGWYWASLADVYHQIERRERSRHALSLELVSQDPWAVVGRPGRIAVGLLRTAIEREPTQYVFYDQLAFALLQYGLRDQALEVVRESARVQPDFDLHLYTNLRPVPPDVLDAFAEASRSALGQVPLLRIGLHHLALAKVELRRGRADQAERELRQAMAAPGTQTNRADAWFHLGMALAALGRHREAVEAFVEAESHPVFAAPGLFQRARIAEANRDLKLAADLLRQARRLRPRDLDYALRYARVARQLDKPEWAEEALRWAAQVHPDDRLPLLELEDLLRDRGDVVGADEVHRALARLGG